MLLVKVSLCPKIIKKGFWLHSCKLTGYKGVWTFYTCVYLLSVAPGVLCTGVHCLSTFSDTWSTLHRSTCVYPLSVAPGVLCTGVHYFSTFSDTWGTFTQEYMHLSTFSGTWVFCTGVHYLLSVAPGVLYI